VAERKALAIRYSREKAFALTDAKATREIMGRFIK
jgi:hypothetical protein